MSHRLDSLNFHLLCTLGLSHDSAEAVIDRINDLKAEVAAKDAEIDKCADALAKTLAWIDEAKPLLEKGGEAERALSARNDALTIQTDTANAERRLRERAENALHQVETRLNDALVELENLRQWKKEALIVESRWDCQAVAKLLEIPLGSDIRPNIEPKIRALLDENARLRLALQQIAGFVDPNSSVHGTAVTALGPSP